MAEIMSSQPPTKPTANCKGFGSRKCDEILADCCISASVPTNLRMMIWIGTEHRICTGTDAEYRCVRSAKNISGHRLRDIGVGLAPGRQFWSTSRAGFRSGGLGQLRSHRSHAPPELHAEAIAAAAAVVVVVVVVAVLVCSEWRLPLFEDGDSWNKRRRRIGFAAAYP